MRYLKQSTAATHRMGPFVDDTDFKAAEVGLTINQADIQISKNGGAFAQTSDASPTVSHDSDGFYAVPLTTTDTNTLGPMRIQIAVAGALIVWEDFHVVTANVYDTMFSTDAYDVNVISISGDSGAADNIEADYDGTGYNKSNSTIGTCTTNTDMRGTDNAMLATEDGSSFTAIPTTDANLVQIGGHTLGGTGTQVADGFEFFFDVLTPSKTMNDVGVAGAGLTAEDVWTYSTRILTAGTNLNDLSAAEVNAEVDTALADYDGPTAAEMAAAFTEIKGATWSAVTDTLEAIRDRGDTSWITATGFSTHDAAAVVTALGTGATLTAVPWNAAWDSEVSDVLTSYGASTFDNTSDQVIVATSNDKTGYSLTAAERTAIATATYTLDVDTVEDTAPADSLAGAMLSLMHWSISGGVLTIYKTDGATEFTTKTLSTDATADPINGMT